MKLCAEELGHRNLTLALYLLLFCHSTVLKNSHVNQFRGLQGAEAAKVTIIQLKTTTLPSRMLLRPSQAAQVPNKLSSI